MKVLSKIKDFIGAYPLFSAMMGFILLMVILGVCSCEPGTIAASNDTEEEYIPVAGVYRVTKGTQEVITNEEQYTKSLIGYHLTVSQNRGIIHSLACLGEIQDNGVVRCEGSEDWGFDMGYGPYLGIVGGKLDFNPDGELLVRTQINGEYTWIDYAYTINLDLEAELVDTENNDDG